MQQSRSIKQTCTGINSGNFFHFNNGVTFLCETASWDQFSLKLTLNHAQIVNGGQTTRVLNKSLDDNTLKNDVLVPVRVITSQGDKEFANNVTVNLNNQNRMKSSFLRSNDPRVIQLENSLVSLGWYLERREKELDFLTDEEKVTIERKIGCPLENKIISLEGGSRAYVSTYFRNPELAKKLSQQIFISIEDGGKFEEIFNDDLSAERFVNAHQIKKQVDEFIRQFKPVKRRRTKGSNWEAGYVKIFGKKLMSKRADLVDQIIPNGAEFISALLFEVEIRQNNLSVDSVVKKLSNQDFSSVVKCIEIIIKFAENNPTAADKKWSTLLQTQAFFERVLNYYESQKPPSRKTKSSK